MFISFCSLHFSLNMPLKFNYVDTCSSNSICTAVWQCFYPLLNPFYSHFIQNDICSQNFAPVNVGSENLCDPCLRASLGYRASGWVPENAYLQVYEMPYWGPKRLYWCAVPPAVYEASYSSTPSHARNQVFSTQLILAGLLRAVCFSCNRNRTCQFQWLHNSHGDTLGILMQPLQLPWASLVSYFPLLLWLGTGGLNLKGWAKLHELQWGLYPESK